MTDQAVSRVRVDPTDITALMSWLAELDSADSYAGFTLMGWVARAPQDAIDNLNKARGQSNEA